MDNNEKFDQLSPKEFILIKGARIHNLKNIDVAIPRNKLSVITGLSGSGKSSLAFDTLYAEGQRRYVESLSSYARQFLGRINKPEVDYIKGISPAIAIEQKVNSRNPRSTVGTTTEIYDYLKLLYARIGKTISPVSGNEVKRHTVSDVVDYIGTLPASTKLMILAPKHYTQNVVFEKVLNLLLQQGFSRILIDNKLQRIEDALATISEKKTKKTDSLKLSIVIDRLVINTEDEDAANRWADSVQTAFYEGEGECILNIELPENSSLDNELESKFNKHFSNRFELDGITFEEPNVHFFSFNNPLGACKICDGFGTTIGIDPDLVIPDKSLSVFEGAVACWKGETMKEWKEYFIKKADAINFPIHRPYYDLTEKQKELLWKGTKGVDGIDAFFKSIEEQAFKIQYRVMLSRYRGKTTCPECLGSRLRKDAQYVKIAGKSICDMVLLSVDETLHFFKNIELSKHDEEVSKRLLIEINNRLSYLCDVGLSYLTLNRMSNTLSGGESQRINLAGSLGSSLVGSMYILDEPSIGLHSRDTERLIGVLKALKKAGNSVIVVEHDEEIMKHADEIIDIGPLSGSQGGNLVFQGNWDQLKYQKESLTAKYLTGTEKINVPNHRRKWKEAITIKGARENNLKGVNVSFPLNTITVVTGVSGSGKTSLVKKILYPSLKKMFEGYSEQTGVFDKIEGSIKLVEAIEMIDQNPIGKSSRSNPATYVKAYDEIRALYAEQALAKTRGYKPSTFSFNVEGGRCDMCLGEGTVNIEMQFMADIELVCENCNGKRFKQDVLEVTFQNKNISELLEMTIDDAISFFEEGLRPGNTEKKIAARLKPLSDVGLGYVQLGQSSSTLSGGEAQRIKLATFLIKGATEKKTLFIFDEPTTGLHFHDIKKLLYAFNALVEQGHSLIIVEHNLEVIKCADWIIDMGPEGGEAGGNVVFEGTPEDLIKNKNSYTGKYLKEKL
ncbi:MAG TPA: excinuclease ABC subunit UvrA [Bacteroidia bacterium]|nr:excinuclease ABC subunit UvrA [Bacteroidia bacterium]